jgi:hypothetical protein
MWEKHFDSPSHHSVQPESLPGEGPLLPEDLSDMNVRVGVAFDVRDSGELPNPDELSEHLGRVLDALLDLEGVVDPDVNATLSEGHVEIFVVVNTDDELAAVEAGVIAVRTAIHAAGGATRWAPTGKARVSTERYELSPA